MPVSELREAFNSVSQPKYTCTLVLFSYDRANGKEWQILKFYGTAADGSKFESISQDLGPGYDLNQAARETAQRLIELGRIAVT